MPTKSAVYAKRSVPVQYDAGFFESEFGNIQRAIQPTVIRSITAAAKQQINDTVVFCNATAGAISYTLLAPALAGPFPVHIKKTDATANAITLVGTVDGTVNPTIVVPMVSLELVSDGTAWWII